ncbi:hypothetical protein ABT160_21515 [Streptomyces sp. NPDC001941]|uniref:hypothetical protein n=1 Tax=Streptomyces sp. NPDC001941 TaxID=3154659 RepID=UPI00331BEC0C
MAHHLANRDASPSRSFWPRVREFAVPATMIETATARRSAGDWAGACAAAGFDVDLDPRAASRHHGPELAARLRQDLRRLAPDLLRWHLPRIAPDGLLRPGLTVSLARYGSGDAGRAPVQLVARTDPAWADAGQRVSLALWDPGRTGPADLRHPHPRPSPRFRLDLHRHLWDATRAHELPERSGVGQLDAPHEDLTDLPSLTDSAWATHRWLDEARLLLNSLGLKRGSVLVRPGGRHRLVLDVTDTGVRARAARSADRTLPVLPDAAVHLPPDITLLRTGALAPHRLHPLVAAALAPGHDPAPPDPYAQGHRHPVDCRGDLHHIALVDGVLTALDHDPAEVRREELLAALGGPPLPCLRAIDRAHRRPDALAGVRERLEHGDTAGALAVVEGLLGREAVLRDGELRDALREAARRRVVHGLFRAGLTGRRDTHPSMLPTPRPGHHRGHPRTAQGSHR